MTETDLAMQLTHNWAQLCVTCGAPRTDGMDWGEWTCSRCITYVKASPGLVLWIMDVIRVAIDNHKEHDHE